MNNLEKAYVLLEITYIKNFDNTNIFPNNWYNIKDYSLKIKILNETLKKNLLIIETEMYNNFINNHSCNI